MTEELQKLHLDPASGLNPAELVQRQQLNILHYWSQKKQEGGAVDESSSEQEAHGTVVVMPERWSLLSGIELHAWQRECGNLWFAAGRRGVVKVVTGAGKTILACSIIERLQNEFAPQLRVAVVVPTIVLLDQWYELLAEHGNLPESAIGRLGGGFQDKLGDPVRILICVLNSAAARLPKAAAECAESLLLVVDECHRAGATQMSKVFATRRAFSLGLSATPEREDASVAEEAGEGLVSDEPPVSFDDSLIGQALGPIIYEMDYLQALEAEILSRFVIHHYGLPLEPEERGRYERLSRDISELRRYLQSQVRGRNIDGSALVGWARRVARGHSPLARQAAQYVSMTGQRKLLVHHAKARQDAVIRLVREALDEDASSRIILFHEAIGEVMRLFQQLRAEGFTAVVEHSQLPESLRQESVHLFRIGAAGILVSARSLIEGFDVPAADVGIVVASSSSVRQRVQTLGRILRKKERTDQAKPAVLHVLYMSDTTDEMIYEKQDWEKLTGAERNRYFKWDPTEMASRPLGQEAPPRRPKPGESQVDWSSLNLGDTYPGSYEGVDFSSDSQGNVRDTTGALMRNPQGVPEQIKELRGGYGRFRVTPTHLAVLVAAGEGTESTIRFAGFLKEPFEAVAQAAAIGTFNEEATTPNDLAPGAEYRGAIAGALELRVKAKATGAVLVRKFRSGEVYARTTQNALDLERGRDAEALLESLVRVEHLEGIRITKVMVVPEQRLAFCEAKGRRLFLCRLKAGLEFKDHVI